MSEYIEFIANYCDRWCERCPFTSRCSSYAVQVAAGMCGDVGDGLELALGIDPRAARSGGSSPIGMDDFELTEKELADLIRLEEQRDARIQKLPTTRFANIYGRRARRWLQEHAQSLLDAADAVLKEAVEIVGWDAHLIGAKLHRAQHGRDAIDEDLSDDPVQTDWNGSAKVALISLERSEAAWRVIAEVSGDPQAAALFTIVSVLRGRVAREFPDAMAFVRPGFDEP
jgi:hypothetical protein